MTDADLRYIVDVNDRDLAVLVKRIKETNKALLTMGTTGEVAGAKGSRGVTQLGAASVRTRREVSSLDRSLAGVQGRLSRGFRTTASFVGLGALVGLGGILAEAKSIVTATEDMQKANAGLDAQLAVLGKDTSGYRKEIEGVVQAQSQLVAVDDEDVKRSLTLLLRATKSVTAAEKLNSLALDISAGRHISVIQSAVALSKAWTGNTTALKRLGIEIPKNASTLQVLESVQRQFAGQAEKAGRTSGASFDRFHISVKNLKEEFGGGFLPGVASGFEELNRQISSPDAMERARELGQIVGHDLDGAVKDVIGFMHDHWGEIQDDFKTAETLIGGAARGAEDLASALEKISKIIPEKGSLIELLVAGALGKRLLFGKGGAGGLAKLGKGLGKGLLEFKGAKALIGRLGATGAGAGAAEAGGATAAESSLLTNPVTFLAGVGLYGFLQSQKPGATGGVPITPEFFARNAARTPLPGDKLGGLGNHGPDDRFAFGDAIFAKRAKQLDAVSKSTDEAGRSTSAFARTTDEATRAAAMYDSSLAGLGKLLDGNDAKLGRLQSQLQAQERSLRSATSLVSSSLGNLVGDSFQVFDRQTQNMVQSFDRSTDAMLTSFDDKTQKMMDGLVVHVKVAGKASAESFTLKDGPKTPAERELDALDALVAKRGAARDTFDAKQSLSDALALGDPDAIRQARRQVEDANLETRRNALDKRAKTERAAADKQLKAAQDALTKRRALERKAIEDGRTRQKQGLDDQRNAERDSMQRTIDSLERQIETGQVKADVGVRKIVAVLRKHGVDFKQAGDLLGQAFAATMQADLHVVDTRASAVARAFERIGKTKASIKAVREEIKKLVDSLAISATNNPRTGSRIVGTGDQAIPKHKASGGTVPGTGTGDTVPAMLTPGEIILNRRQQRPLARKLGVVGGPHELFAEIQKLATGGGEGRGDSHARRYSTGGVVKKLREELARNSLADFRLRAAGKVQHPLHIEGLVKSAVGHGDKALEQELAQAQAHPVLSGLIDPRPTSTSPVGLGTRTIATPGAPPRGAFAGTTNYITIHVDGRGESDEQLARKMARELEKRLQRN